MTIDEFNRRLDEIAKEPDGEQLLLMMDMVESMLRARYGDMAVTEAVMDDMAAYLEPFYAAIVGHPHLTRAVREDYSGRLQ